MASHETPQSSEQLAGQPANPGRRLFMQRAAAVTTATAIGLVLPEAVFAAQRQFDSPTPLTADGRIADARRQLARIERQHPSHLPRIAAETLSAIEGKTSFRAGEKVDRGNPNQKVIYVRVDDFWWEQQGNDYFDVVEELDIPVTALPVEPAVTAYPDLFRRADSLKSGGKKLVEWANHGTQHNPMDAMSMTEILQDLLPQNHALENLLLREENSLFLGPPYGAGALPGERTESQIVTAAKRLRQGVLGWTLDTESYNGNTPDQIVSKVLNGVRKGSIIITHPEESGSESQAMRRWVPALRNRGWRIGRLSELAHPGVGA